MKQREPETKFIERAPPETPSQSWARFDISSKKMVRDASQKKPFPQGVRTSNFETGEGSNFELDAGSNFELGHGGPVTKPALTWGAEGGMRLSPIPTSPFTQVFVQESCRRAPYYKLVIGTQSLWGRPWGQIFLAMLKIS